MSGTGCGLGLVVFPCISISHVFERFNVILLLAAQSLMLLTSLIVSTIFAYWDADGNVVCKLHQKVSSRVS